MKVVGSKVGDGVRSLQNIYGIQVKVMMAGKVAQGAEQEGWRCVVGSHGTFGASGHHQCIVAPIQIK